MSNDGRLLSDIAHVKSLAARLHEVYEVRKYDTEGHNEAWFLADSFADLEESVAQFQRGLNRLVSEDLGEAEITDLLLDIGEEFRHILYHVRTPEFYAYLRDIGEPVK
jgi:hypothetical protein